MLKYFRTHLAWKVFLTYVIVILVGIAVLATAISISAPASFNRHMAGMSAMMSRGSMMGNGRPMATLFDDYQDAVIEAVSLAAGAALVAALLASYLISRQVVGPIQKMMRISHRVAEGDYGERLDISGSPSSDQVDELNQLALSFNQMAEKLEKTESMRRQLIGDVSHELRTPLTAIKGYMEGLMDGVIPAAPDTFQQVYTEADRLQHLVNDLQELSRVEAGAYPLRIEPTPVTDLITPVVNRLGYQFEEKGISLIAEPIGKIPDVLADRERILQVLTNLLGNALQYSLPGGTVKVQVRQEKSQEVIFQISDTGIGISAEHLPHIFDRFYRTDKSRARASGGSGIGLTIAQALVKAHHGKIWAESPGEGKGSSFSFTLPMVIPPE